MGTLEDFRRQEAAKAQQEATARQADKEREATTEAAKAEAVRVSAAKSTLLIKSGVSERADEVARFLSSNGKRVSLSGGDTMQLESIISERLTGKGDPAYDQIPMETVSDVITIEPNITDGSVRIGKTVLSANDLGDPLNVDRAFESAIKSPERVAKKGLQYPPSNRPDIHEG